MKTIKSTQPFYVLGVKFENVPEAILYAIKGLAKNGVYVGKDVEDISLFRLRRLCVRRPVLLEYSVCKIQRGTG